MRIFIITMEDPLYTLPFIKDIIKNRKNDVVGLAISEGGRLKIGKNKSKLVYLSSLLLIMGIGGFVKNTFSTITYKLKVKLSKLLPINNPSLLAFCKEHAIAVEHIKSPNNVEFLKRLRTLNPDVIINQSQYIIKADLLAIPKLGMLNRHNALLPKNRGRLTPFWVLYKQEKETGVSIHFVEEGMDSGPIVVQEKFAVTTKDNFNTIVDKNYKIASGAMIKALELLEHGNYTPIPNNESEATYNTIPTFKEALQYRLRKLGLSVN